MIEFAWRLKNETLRAANFASLRAQAGDLIMAARAKDFGGFIDLPVDDRRAELAKILQLAKQIRAQAEVLVCIGIGGSYLGHKALIEALGGAKGKLRLLYAGNNLSSEALAKILKALEGRDFALNVISKSGTTTEPAVAFRILKQLLIQRYGEEEAKKRIYATTDAHKGALYEEAVQKQYHRLVIPDNIGGRYSVLTAVGLLPMAAVGIDIEAVLSGARHEREDLLGVNSNGQSFVGMSAKAALAGGAAADYAALRQSLYATGSKIEVLASFEPRLASFAAWRKQLFGESEGKDGKGIYPSSVTNTTDLHAMGQYLQQGERHLMESFLSVKEPVGPTIRVPKMDSVDGLAYLEGKSLAEINRVAEEATMQAHFEGGLPIMKITITRLDEENLGALVYFFELACAMSGQMSGVDPFNQPGVEAYKTEMFRRLGKPGY